MTRPIEVVAIIDANTISSILVLLIGCELDMLSPPVDSFTASVRQIGRRTVPPKDSRMRKMTSLVYVVDLIR